MEREEIPMFWRIVRPDAVDPVWISADIAPTKEKALALFFDSFPAFPPVEIKARALFFSRR